MKKTLFILFAAVALSSCGTVYGGRVSDYQKTKPVAGTVSRSVRPAALVGDLLFFPLISVPVDFLTGAIYKPLKNK